MKIFIYPYNLYSKYLPDILFLPHGAPVYIFLTNTIYKITTTPQHSTLSLSHGASLVSNVNIGLFSPIVCATRKTSTDLNTKIKVCST